MQNETKNCQNCKNDFIIEPNDFGFYEKIKVPPPTWCPECRMKRRIMWRNEKTMHRNKCAATGKTVFSSISPESPYKIYDRDYWWSDKWDPLEYGREVDFSRPFLEQLNELMHDVPWYSRSVINNVKSDYCMNASYLKDCYLLFHSSKNESCYYGVGISLSKDCFDNSFLEKCELCHQCFFCTNCYQAYYSVDCENSQELFLCRDCINCHDCFGCAGLRNKQYHIFNKPFSKDEYEEERKRLLGSYKSFFSVREKAIETWLKAPVKYAHETHNQNISGDYINNSKNLSKSYIMIDSEDCKYCQNVFQSPGAKNSYDYSFFGQGAELIYEACSTGIQVSEIKFSSFIYPDAQRITYSVMCPSSRDLFGCVSLRSKQYCILNRQYSKEEYLALVPKVIEHMNNMPYTDKKGRIYRYGEFFPPEFCPFGYNETVAQEYFPKTKKEAEEGGWPWIEPDMKEYEPDLSWKNIPDKVSDSGIDITEKVILCQSWDEEGSEKALERNCSKAFRIVSREFEFYKKYDLPLPRKCFFCRHYDRGKFRNPLKLWHRQCMCTQTSHGHAGDCKNEFETSYAPDRPEIVYCESCYQKEVY